MFLKQKGIHKIKVGFINDPMAGVGVGWSYMQGVPLGFAWTTVWG